ncbi:MAG: IS1595 family transposase [Terriglobales bacterium]
MKTALNLCTLIEKYNDDEKCRETIKHLRWPAGVSCPRCGSDNVSPGPISDRKVFVCYSCRYQFSATVGTIFHDSHLPLTTWFFVTYLMTESRKGISANQIKRMLGISYKTAWYLCHRIRAAMVEADPEKLDGTVEVDETYVGGKPRRGVSRKRGRGTPKEIVIGIRKRNGDLRFFHADDVRSGTLANYIRQNVSEDVDVVMTDDFTAYPKAIAKAGVLGEHQAINHSKGVYVIGDLHTNTVESAFSLLKRGIMGTWHKISAKHLPAYLDEMTFRFNNRDNRFLFRDTLLKLIESSNLEYKELTKAA